MSNLPSNYSPSQGLAGLEMPDVQKVLDEFRNQEQGMAYGTQALRGIVDKDIINITSGKDVVVARHDSSNPLVAQVIVGVPARALRARGFIRGADDPKPICTSNDGGQNGIVDLLQFQKYPGLKLNPNARNVCATCAYGGKGAWGTGIDQNTGEMGRGKACREMRHLLLWSDDYTMPIIITASPSSIGAFDSYRSKFRAKVDKATGNADDYFRHYTKITPRKESKDGKVWGVLVFEDAGVVPFERFMEAKMLRDEFVPTLYNMTEDINEEEALRQQQAEQGFGDGPIIDAAEPPPFE